MIHKSIKNSALSIVTNKIKGLIPEKCPYRLCKDFTMLAQPTQSSQIIKLSISLEFPFTLM